MNEDKYIFTLSLIAVVNMVAVILGEINPILGIIISGLCLIPNSLMPWNQEVEEKI